MIKHVMGLLLVVNMDKKRLEEKIEHYTKQGAYDIAIRFIDEYAGPVGVDKEELLKKMDKIKNRKTKTKKRRKSKW